MKPLINLKAFLAVLLILIITGSLLVAYFRDYSATAEGHDHGKMEKSGGGVLNDGVDPGAMKPIYHVGATGFFLDHPQQINLSAEQRKALNRIQVQAALGQASAGRKLQEAEQQLWRLTAADQPDPAKIDTKVRELEKLRSDQRIGFIQAVGEAAKVLTEEQRVALGGKAAPATSAAMAAASGHQHKP